MKLTVLLILFSVISLFTFGQNRQLIKIKFRHSEEVKIKYHVLESDSSVKDGSYLEFHQSNGNAVIQKVKGQYNSNIKSGIWYWYSEESEVERIYDYDTKKYIQGKINLITEIRYPEEAILNNIEGIVTVEYSVDCNCNVQYVKVLKGIGSGCDEEAERTIRAKFMRLKEKGYPCEAKTEKIDITFDIKD